MAESAIAADVHQPFDVHRYFTPEIAFDSHLFVDDFANAVDLVIGQIAHARIGTDIRSLQQHLTGVESDPINVWQRCFDSLVARKIDSCNSRHARSP